MGLREKSVRELAMKAAIAGVAMILWAAAGPAVAQEGSFRRVLECKNDGARVELYLPESIVSGLGIANVRLAQPARGYYALDLSDAGKGKPLEPVRVRMATDKKGVVVNQYTRKLPPTTVPLAGGKVSFDKRFAEDMECKPFNGE
jgi:hypothetical protein